MNEPSKATPLVEQIARKASAEPPQPQEEIIIGGTMRRVCIKCRKEFLGTGMNDLCPKHRQSQPIGGTKLLDEIASILGCPRDAEAILEAVRRLQPQPCITDCHICGEDAVIVPCGNQFFVRVRRMSKCKKESHCKTNLCATKQEAIDAWNYRI